jgi:hypothetical protein
MKIWQLTMMIAFVASVRRDGWCLMSSSMELPRLLAVSPETCHTLDTLFTLNNTLIQNCKISVLMVNCSSLKHLLLQ